LVPIESSQAYTTSYQNDTRQVLRIKSCIYESAKNLYRGRRAVSLQTYSTKHSNRKLYIIMALSTTFTQYALEITEFGKNNAKMAISPCIDAVIYTCQY